MSRYLSNTKRERQKFGQDVQLDKARHLRNYYCQIKPQELYSLHIVRLLRRTLSYVTDDDVEQRRKASITETLKTLKTADKNKKVHREPTRSQRHSEVAGRSKLKPINL